MLEGLAIVFIPLFLGYLIKSEHKSLVRRIDNALMICLYIIIVLMGYNVGVIDNVLTKLPTIGLEALSLLILLLVLNVVVLAVYDRYKRKKLAKLNHDLANYSQNTTDTSSDFKAQLFSSIKIILLVVLGFIIGFYFKKYIRLHSDLSTFFLVILIFLVGISLRNSGMKIRDIFFNKHGIITAFFFMFSCLIGGLIFAIIFDYKLSIGLTLASGFGWYSLSSIFISKELGVILGSIAFFNDFLRELLAFILIPILIQNRPATAIAIGGATSMDCSLPVISKSGGVKLIPLALSFGLVVNLFTPILMGVFINIYNLGWF